ncbi:hypothetical protein BASA62_009602 [Batrachochytrium salamandrivorans]|nr:hypothetical protein BASA62_009602 [Batrachochytrium salamandrivorans]
MSCAATTTASMAAQEVGTMPRAVYDMNDSGYHGSPLRALMESKAADEKGSAHIQSETATHDAARTIAGLALGGHTVVSLHKEHALKACQAERDEKSVASTRNSSTNAITDWIETEEPPADEVVCVGALLDAMNSQIHTSQQLDEQTHLYSATVLSPEPSIQHDSAADFIPRTTVDRATTDATTDATEIPEKTAPTMTSMITPATLRYVCTVASCGRIFTKPYNLKSHMMVHTGVRKHECTFCLAAFVRRHDLLRHNRILHGGNLPKSKGRPGIGKMGSAATQGKKNRITDKSTDINSGASAQTDRTGLTCAAKVSIVSDGGGLRLSSSGGGGINNNNNSSSRSSSSSGGGGGAAVTMTTDALTQSCSSITRTNDVTTDLVLPARSLQPTQLIIPSNPTPIYPHISKQTETSSFDPGSQIRRFSSMGNGKLAWHLQKPPVASQEEQSSVESQKQRFLSERILEPHNRELPSHDQQIIYKHRFNQRSSTSQDSKVDSSKERGEREKQHHDNATSICPDCSSIIHPCYNHSGFLDTSDQDAAVEASQRRHELELSAKALPVVEYTQWPYTIHEDLEEQLGTQHVIQEVYSHEAPLIPFQQQPQSAYSPQAESHHCHYYRHCHHNHQQQQQQQQQEQQQEQQQQQQQQPPPPPPPPPLLLPPLPLLEHQQQLYQSHRSYHHHGQSDLCFDSQALVAPRAAQKHMRSQPQTRGHTAASLLYKAPKYCCKAALLSPPHQIRLVTSASEALRSDSAPVPKSIFASVSVEASASAAAAVPVPPVISRFTTESTVGSSFTADYTSSLPLPFAPHSTATEAYSTTSSEAAAILSLACMSTTNEMNASPVCKESQSRTRSRPSLPSINSLLSSTFPQQYSLVPQDQLLRPPATTTHTRQVHSSQRRCDLSVPFLDASPFRGALPPLIASARSATEVDCRIPSPLMPSSPNTLPGVNVAGCLQNWFLRKRDVDTQYPSACSMPFWVALSGDLLDSIDHSPHPATAQLWTTSYIVARLDANHIRTSSGKVYRLVGQIHTEKALADGFSASICDAFRNGFPADWKSLIEPLFRQKDMPMPPSLDETKLPRRSSAVQSSPSQYDYIPHSISQSSTSVHGGHAMAHTASPYYSQQSPNFNTDTSSIRVTIPNSFTETLSEVKDEFSPDYNGPRIFQSRSAMSSPTHYDEGAAGFVMSKSFSANGVRCKRSSSESCDQGLSGGPLSKKSHCTSQSTRSNRIPEKYQSVSGPFVCAVEGCNKAFSRIYKLKSHQAVHEGKQHPCSFCGLQFARRHDLYRHARSIHSLSRKFHCRDCFSGYEKLEQYLRHLTLSKHDRRPITDEIRKKFELEIQRIELTKRLRNLDDVLGAGTMGQISHDVGVSPSISEHTSTSYSFSHSYPPSRENSIEMSQSVSSYTDLGSKEPSSPANLLRPPMASPSGNTQGSGSSVLHRLSIGSFSGMAGGDIITPHSSRPLVASPGLVYSPSHCEDAVTSSRPRSRTIRLEGWSVKVCPNQDVSNGTTHHVAYDDQDHSPWLMIQGQVYDASTLQWSLTGFQRVVLWYSPSLVQTASGDLLSLDKPDISLSRKMTGSSVFDLGIPCDWKSAVANIYRAGAGS